VLVSDVLHRAWTPHHRLDAAEIESWFKPHGGAVGGGLRRLQRSALRELLQSSLGLPEAEADAVLRRCSRATVTHAEFVNIGRAGALVVASAFEVLPPCTGAPPNAAHVPVALRTVPRSRSLAHSLLALLTSLFSHAQLLAPFPRASDGVCLALPQPELLCGDVKVRLNRPPIMTACELERCVAGLRAGELATVQVRCTAQRSTCVMRLGIPRTTDIHPVCTVQIRRGCNLICLVVI
jgi:hypothetical protein